MASEPFVRVSLQLDKLVGFQIRHAARRNATEGVPYSTVAFVHDFENPPAGLVDLLLLVVVALADVRPIGDIDASIGAIFGVQAAEPWVAGIGEVGRVLRYDATTVAL